MVKNGFYFTFGNRGIFIESDHVKKTDSICKLFINALCDEKGICHDLRERALNDKATLDDFRRRIDLAILRKNVSESGFVYFTISGKNFMCNFPVQDFVTDIIFIGKDGVKEYDRI